MRNLFTDLAVVIILGTSPASAAVNFMVQFEPGSRWFTESWSAAARTEMLAYFSDLGQLFDSNAEAVIMVTDNEQNAYASAAAGWFTFAKIDGRDGDFHSTALWSIIVKGLDENGPEPDAYLNWNLNVNALYQGSPTQLIANIRGLARHEMHHAFGEISWLSHSTTYDPRGSRKLASLADGLCRDVNDASLLGPYSIETGDFIVNNYALAANWATTQNGSGVYFPGRNIRGEVVKMPLISFNGQIDFSHIVGIAYVSDHPSWRNYEDTDRNFLRALGYPLMVDAQLSQRAPVADFRVVGSNAEISFRTLSTRFYRVSRSRDLRQWFVQPAGVRGSGLTTTLALPLLQTEKDGFFEVVEIP